MIKPFLFRTPKVLLSGVTHGDTDIEEAFTFSFIEWKRLRWGNDGIRLQGRAPGLGVTLEIMDKPPGLDAALALEIETDAPLPVLAQVYAALRLAQKGRFSRNVGFFMARCLPRKHRRQYQRRSSEQLRGLAEDLLRIEPFVLLERSRLEESVSDLTHLDQVGLLMLLGRELWNPAQAARLAPLFTSAADPWNLHYVGSLAMCAPDIEAVNVIEVSGVPVQLPPRTSAERMLIFPQYLEWIIFRAPANLIETVHRRALPTWAPFERYLENLDAETLETLEQTAEALIRAALAHQRYVPEGDFWLRLPDEMAGLLGVETLRLMIDPDGIWVIPHQPQKDRYGSSFRYRPRARQRISLLMCGSGYREVLDVILSALWYDLVAGGDAVFPSSRIVAQRSSRPSATVPARPLPRIYRPKVCLYGWRTWGSEEERQVIRRRAHHVRGFLRRLPSGWRPSETAVQDALMYGLIVPEGYTFVRPHIRGRQRGEDSPVEIRSRGLATAMVVLTQATAGTPLDSKR